jgi:hypothetical protein
MTTRLGRGAGGLAWLLAPVLAAAHESLPGVAHDHGAADWHDVLAGAGIVLLAFGGLALLYRATRKGG